MVLGQPESSPPEDSGVAQEMVSRLLHINAATGRATVLADLPRYHPGLLQVSPIAPLAVLAGPPSEHEGEKAFLHILTPKADLGKVIFLPDGVEGFISVRWSADGRSPVLTAISRTEGDEPPRPVFYVVDPVAGELSPVEKPEVYSSPEENPDLSLSEAEASLAAPKGSPPLKARLALLAASKPTPGEHAFAAAAIDAEQAALSPTRDSVAYVAHGAAFVREIVRVPKEVYLEAHAAARRSHALADAKQVALGILMHAADNEDRLPSAQEFPHVLLPYLKAEGPLQAFVYLAPADRIADIESPSVTRLGYIPVPPEG